MNKFTLKMCWKINHLFVVIGLAFFTIHPLFCQNSTDSVFWNLKLDSVVIRAIDSGFDVKSFIRLVEDDTTFYQAFQNLKTINYSSNSSIRMFDNKHFVKASYSNEAYQYINENCRWMDFDNQTTTGDFFDTDGEQNYYTAKLFAYIFLYSDTICSYKEVESSAIDNQLEKRKDQLKILLFDPGKPVAGIPLIKNKMSIFDAKMIEKYNYSIISKWDQHSIDCYIFSVVKKESVNDNEVVVKQMNTWFDKKTFAIVARDYVISYNSIPFDFDVTMDVKIGLVHGISLPIFIAYNGFWNVPSKKAEYGSVIITVSE